MPRPRLAEEADYYRLPEAPPAAIDAGGFQLWSTGFLPDFTGPQLQGLADLYRHAFEMACDAARPTHPETVLFAVWN
jgi:hypothetical protein